MTNKEDFLRQFGQRVTVCFNVEQFIQDNTVIWREREVTLEEVGGYFCPWHYRTDTLQEYDVSFEEVLQNPIAKAVTIQAVETRIKLPSKSGLIRQYIDDFKGKPEKPLSPFPVANDTTFKKRLVLDGNKTLVALYQSWGRDRKIPIAEIVGEYLIRVLPDFCILYRS